MAGEIAKWDDAGATFERDLKVTDMLCAGFPIAEVARRENLSVHEVQTSLVRITGAASPAIKEQALRTIYGRMERIHRAHYVNALKGNYDATVCCIRANETIARLLGLNAPQTTASPLDDMREIETTTDKIQAALDRIQGIKTTIIEGEVIEQPAEPPDKGGQDG